MTASASALATLSITERVDRLAWRAVSGELDDSGVAQTAPLLGIEQCRAVIDLYAREGVFRSTVDMARHRFGEGKYRYFRYPLPDVVGELRHAFWPHLLPIARQWAQRRDQPSPWPDDLDEWLDQCHSAGQRRPTALLLRYGAGDWNALHQDLYGDCVFPLQITIGLDRPGVDYTGGEFVVVEQRLRAQSRATAVAIGQGRALVFTTRDRPVPTKRGWANAPMRHGVSTVRSGHRHTLGLIFHDAK